MDPAHRFNRSFQSVQVSRNYISCESDGCCLGALSAAHASHTHLVLDNSSSANSLSASLVERSSLIKSANSQIGLIASSGLPTRLVKLSSFSLSVIDGLPRYAVNLRPSSLVVARFSPPSSASRCAKIRE